MPPIVLIPYNKCLNPKLYQFNPEEKVQVREEIAKRSRNKCNPVNEV